MPRDSEDDVIEKYVRPIQRTVSCITLTPLVYTPQTGSSFQYLVEFGPDSSVASLKDQTLLFSIQQGVSVVQAQSGDWIAQLGAYLYTVMDDRFRPLFSYEWHPHRHRSDPHFQIKQGASHHGLNKCHFPTGLIPLEAVIRLLIEEMDVRPIRNDWDDVLTRKGEQSE